MSKTPYQTQDLAATDQFVTPYVILPYRTATTTVGAPATGVFHSTIIGRGKMVDLSNDLSVRMGIERIQVQSVMRIDGETGPAGEVVYKPVNDKYDQIRMVGGGWVSNNNVYGTYATSALNLTDYCEITFYGTGLNFLTVCNATAYDVRATVDGGTEGSNLYAIYSNVLAARNYASNQVLVAVSGLTLGLHTVRLRNNTTGASLNLHGFEILNTASTLQISAGSALVNGTAASLSAATTSAYNSGFESGTLGTRGGRVLVYMKNDGTIGKAVTPTDASSLTLTSTNHANEEVIRTYFPREFGAGRADDFSTAMSSRSGAFTLDDGTTTLVTNNALIYFSNGREALRQGGNLNDFCTLTFVGTGLDFIMSDSSVGGSDVYSFSIDGGSPIVYSTTGTSTAWRTVKVASGLPYGTHTVKFICPSAFTNAILTNTFIVYGPKKPTIPAGAMELADYNIMANFVANATEGSGRISTGVLRKAGTREAVYSGTWDAISIIDANTEPGFYIRATANASYVEYTFFGTGFDLRHGAASNGDPASQLTLNGSTNFSAYTTSFYGTGINFTAATGVLDQQGGDTHGVGVVVSGLPLGVHKLRMAKTSGTYIYAPALDIITPIHVHKNNGPYVLQNTLAVGSQGINDGRKFGSQLVAPKNTCRAQGVQTFSSTATSPIPVPDMECTIKTSGNPIRVSSLLNIYGSLGGNGPAIYVYIDGVAVTPFSGHDVASAQIGLSIGGVFPVSAGIHTVQILWAQAGGTGAGYLDRRLLFVEEIANS